MSEPAVRVAALNKTFLVPEREAGLSPSTTAAGLRHYSGASA